MTTKKIIFYELNEVSMEFINRFTRAYPASSLSKILKKSESYKTLTSDEGHLSPWVTWPTLHRGVNNTKHRISDFGQDLKDLNIKYPPFYELIASQNIQTGIFGSIHSYPVPQDKNNYAFYIPDTFAETPEAHPKIYSDFQKLNLQLTKKNGKNVSTKLPILKALVFLFKAPFMGLSFRTIKRSLIQILVEIFNKSRVVRRRTSQAQIAFDFFFNLLSQKKPACSTFFTNHVASAMHRYWPATFPDDYVSFVMPEKWIKTYKDEIWFAMKEADYQLGKLTKFISENPDFTLAISSSMGQSAVQESVKLSSMLMLKEPKKLFSFLGFDFRACTQKMAMIPQYIFEFNSSSELISIIEKLKNIKIINQPIEFKIISAKTLRFTILFPNFDLSCDSITYFNKKIHPSEIGLCNEIIQDETGTYAYHVPNGVLIIYNGDGTYKTDKPILTTRIAPSLLRHFKIPIPEYMEKPLNLF